MIEGELVEPQTIKRNGPFVVTVEDHFASLERYLGCLVEEVAGHTQLANAKQQRTAKVALQGKIAAVGPAVGTIVDQKGASGVSGCADKDVVQQRRNTFPAGSPGR